MPDFQAPTILLSGIAPEIALAGTALLLMVVSGFITEHRFSWYLPFTSTVGFVLATVLAIRGLDGVNDLQLSGSVAADNFAVFVKVSLAVFGLLTVWLARDYLTRDRLEEPEFYALVLFSVAGMMLMAGAADLIVMFLALETFSISLYVLVGFRRGSLVGQEGAMKYFLLGAFSSAFFLLGIALMYGAVGGTNLYGSADSQDGIVTFLSSAPVGSYGLVIIATGLLIVGLGFKVAAVPFHMWTPDAYQGAPSPVTGLMAAGTKLAAFAALIRLLDVTLFTLRLDWRPIIVALAVVTMIVGSVLAIVQEDVKRILAYSSIAHAGFVLTGVLAANDRGVSGTLFYLATYGLTVLGAFGVVAVLGGRDERRVRLVDYRGLFYEHPGMAAALSLFLLSLAGVPVTVGFVGKLVVFGAAIQAGYTWVVVVGLLASAVAAFFYIRILVVMYMQEPTRPGPATPFGVLSGGVVALTAVATIALGLYWGPLIQAAENATLYFVTG
ncbi:NADH-quinone oxidoreductase subunit N [soil metagenome]